MKRLTDTHVAKNLEENLIALAKVDIEPSPLYLDYVKLSKYEDYEEQHGSILSYTDEEKELLGYE